MSAERRRYWRPGMSLEINPARIVRHSAVAAVVAGVLMGIAMLLVQVAIDRALGQPYHRPFYSDMLMGLLTAIVTGLGLRHYQKHMEADRAHMRMIAEMNHHVRNALAAISLSVYAKNDPELETITREATQRIDWALREVLVSPEDFAGAIPPKPVSAQSATRRSA